METDIKVGDVMSKGIITVSPADSVKRACEIMAKHDLSGLTVLEKGKLVGMLTQGDLVPMIANGENHFGKTHLPTGRRHRDSA